MPISAMASTIRPGAMDGNSRNGCRPKTVVTEVGPVELGCAA